MLADVIEYSERPCALVGIVVRMNAKIEQCKFELAQHTKRHAEMPAAVQADKDFFRQRFGGAVMSRALFQYLVMPGKILHKLAWQLDRIPRHSIDSGDARKIYPGQQVMQHMAEFMKQCEYVIVG